MQATIINDPKYFIADVRFENFWAREGFGFFNLLRLAGGSDDDIVSYRKEKRTTHALRDLLDYILIRT